MFEYYVCFLKFIEIKNERNKKIKIEDDSNWPAQTLNGVYKRGCCVQLLGEVHTSSFSSPALVKQITLDKSNVVSKGWGRREQGLRHLSVLIFRWEHNYVCFNG